MPSLPEAIKQKYGDQDGGMMDVSCIALNLRRCGRFRPQNVLILANCDIEAAGDEDELRMQCDGVKELDLSTNKFRSWTEVFKILKATPALTFLNLSYNHFENNVYNPDYGRLDLLSRLILNGVEVPWKDVYALLELAPSIEELHLCLNNFEKVEVCSKKYNHIRCVHFNGNPIVNWQEIGNLGTQFPSLEVLILADCPLKSIEPCNFDEVFPKLTHLSLRNCDISSWNSVDQLSNFPCLTNLKLNHCPLFQSFSDEERRSFTIARLSKIATLNGGGIISENERDKAERTFIRHYKAKADKPTKYHELIQIHGELLELAEVSLKPQKKVSIKVSHGQKSFEKQISVYIKVCEFKKLLEQETGLTTSQMRLYYIDKFYGISYAPDELKINNKQLYTLNLHSGDEFVVDAKIAHGSPSKV